MKLQKEVLKIVYVVVSILIIVIIPLIYSDIYDRLLYKIFNDAFVSSNVVAISPSYVSGMIKKIYIKSGDSVKKGQLIVLIDDTLYRANLDESEARLNALKFRLNQLKSQFGEDDSKYMDIEKEAQIFEQDVKTAKLMLSYTRIVSPVNGIVAKDVLHAGDSISPSNVIMYIYNPSTLYVKAYIKLKYVSHFKVGMRVFVKTNKKTIAGDVGKIGGVDVFNVCNKNNPVVPIKIEVPVKDRKFLTFGMPVEIVIK